MFLFFGMLFGWFAVDLYVSSGTASPVSANRGNGGGNPVSPDQPSASAAAIVW
jgi:hypothetical protein